MRRRGKRFADACVIELDPWGSGSIDSFTVPLHSPKPRRRTLRVRCDPTRVRALCRRSWTDISDYR